VRGIAILLVMVFHFWVFGAQPARQFDRVVWTVVGAGWTGVDLFFVLSGFLITGILLDARGRPHDLRNFYVRRVLRIFPLYYVALTTLSVLGALAALVRHHPYVGPTVWYWLYLTNVAMALRGDAGPYWMSHFWSLAVEEQFYLVWPWVVRWLGPRRLAILCLWLLGVALVGRLALQATGVSIFVAYAQMPTRIDSLAAGALLACWMRDGSKWAAGFSRGAAAGFWAALLVFVALALAQGSPAPEKWLLTVGLTCAELASAFLILHVVIAAPEGAAARAVRRPTLMAFGKYSYGLYVIHVPVQYVMVRVARGLEFTVLRSAIPDALVHVAVGIALSYALARISWRFIEQPFLTLKERFA
jgi:peptidoglycan/LPS O-acetylase OafA/YrhL